MATGKLHKALRKRFIDKDLTQQDAAYTLGWTDNYLSRRLLARNSFNMADVYQICKKFGIPVDQIHIYFPLEGKVDYDKDFTVDRGRSIGDCTYFNVGLEPVDSAEKLYFMIATR